MKVYDGAYNAVQLDLFTPDENIEIKTGANTRFNMTATPNLYALMEVASRQGTAVQVRKNVVVASAKKVMDGASMSELIDLHTPYGTVQLRCSLYFVHTIRANSNMYGCCEEVGNVCHKIESWLAGNMDLPAGKYNVQMVDRVDTPMRRGVDVGGESMAQVAATLERVGVALNECRDAWARYHAANEDRKGGGNGK